MAKRKARTKKDDNVIFLQKLVDEQAGAVKNGPKVRKFTTHDLKSIRPLTFGQQHMFESYFSGNTVVANGSAGTGKSFSAVYLALTDLLREQSEFDEIIGPQADQSPDRFVNATAYQSGEVPGEFEAGVTVLNNTTAQSLPYTNANGQVVQTVWNFTTIINAAGQPETRVTSHDVPRPDLQPDSPQAPSTGGSTGSNPGSNTGGQPGSDGSPGSDGQPGEFQLTAARRRLGRLPP